MNGRTLLLQAAAGLTLPALATFGVASIAARRGGRPGREWSRVYPEHVPTHRDRPDWGGAQLGPDDRPIEAIRDKVFGVVLTSA